MAATSPDQPAAQREWRRAAPGVLTALLRRTGHLEDCEDAVQEALLAASQQWPRDGVPDNPHAWLLRVASRRLIDQIRAEVARREREERAVRLEPPVPSPASPDDDLFALMALCAHPCLSPASQAALMLRAVGGLTTREIAAGFFVPEATMAQRISRAKARLRAAGARFEPPAASAQVQRGPAVRAAITLVFTHANDLRLPRGPATDGVATAIGLARSLVRACPSDPENIGLLALLLLTDARCDARSGDGDLVPLAEQDRTRWDRAAIAEGVGLVTAVLPRGYVGSYQLQAAIAAVHAEAATAADTDWPQIAQLYEMLVRVDPSPAAALGRAIALGEAAGPQVGLAEVERLTHTGHRETAARGHLLAMVGREDEARAAFASAAARATSIPEQRYLNRLATGRSQP